MPEWSKCYDSTSGPSLRRGRGAVGMEVAEHGRATGSPPLLWRLAVGGRRGTISTRRRRSFGWRC
jgi:hypothetical protein